MLAGEGGGRAAGGAELRPAGPAARGRQEWAERGRWSKDGRREAGEQGAGGCVLWEEEGRAGRDDEGKRSTSLCPIERKMTGSLQKFKGMIFFRTESFFQCYFITMIFRWYFQKTMIF